jgi:pyruvate formate lyase activating enzyme
MSGKLKCKYLKEYRAKIASKYGIKGFKYKKCKSKGECIGTCPKCEEELKELNVKVNEKIEKMSTTFGGLNLGYNDKFIKSVNSKLILNEDEDDGWNFIENKYRFIELLKTLDNVDCHTPIKLYNYRINKSKDILSELIRNPSKTVGKIFGIERLRINTDGEGITTLVGMAGCPLKCVYCINKDIGTIHNITVDELYDLVLQDDLYYNSSDGGICFGGNEPLLQADFILSFIKKVRKEKKTWKIGIETSLSVYNSSSIEELLKNVDYIIADIKSMDKLKYQAYTNCSDIEISMLYKNLKYILEKVCRTNLTIKVPIIEGYTNDSDVSKSVRDLLQMGFLYKNIKVVEYVIPESVIQNNLLNDDCLTGYMEPQYYNKEDGNIGLLEWDMEGDIDPQYYDESEEN